MVLNRPSSDILRVIILTVILVYLTSCRPEHKCSNNVPGKYEDAKCSTEPKSFNLSFTDCDPIQLCLNVCKGICPTFQLIKQGHPFKEGPCTCCKPTKYASLQIRKKNMCHTGSGAIKKVQKTIVYKKIMECACLNCY